MRFRTEIGTADIMERLDPDKPVAALGSCFAGEMTARMRRSLWPAFNPGGALFNPASIAAVTELMLFSEDAEAEFRDGLFEKDGIYRSWLFDSSMASLSPEEAVSKFLKRRDDFVSALEEGEVLLVTFGTAYCYELRDGELGVVANCHKQPQSMFRRVRLGVEEIAVQWTGLALRLRDRFPGLRIIMTVSPVRHVRDGLHENTLSKATLHLAVERICAGIEFCEYFPAYEALIDDLRDYRFYASDMAHPSEMAADYIWELFCRTYLDDAGRARLLEGERLTRRLGHRPIIAGDPAAEQFRRETERLLREFINRHPSASRLANQ